MKMEESKTILARGQTPVMSGQVAPDPPCCFRGVTYLHGGADSEGISFYF